MAAMRPLPAIPRPAALAAALGGAALLALALAGTRPARWPGAAPLARGARPRLKYEDDYAGAPGGSLGGGLSAPSQQRHWFYTEDAGQEERREEEAGPRKRPEDRHYEPRAGFWLMCPSLEGGGCQEPSMQRWTRDPAELALSVGDMLTVPGIPASMYAPAAEHWTQSPPLFRGRRIELSAIADYVRQLLASDPFGTGVEVPYVDLGNPTPGVDTKTVAITQKQLAFIVANVIMGNDIPMANGLSAALQACGGQPAGPKGIVDSLLSFLAVLSDELQAGDQGTMLIAASPRDEATATRTWTERLSSRFLEEPTVCFSDGTQCSTVWGELPSQGDFMSGGVPQQALTDIAGTVVGGGGGLCDTANTQDESLVLFYSEVLAFAFFAAQGKTQLLVPLALLGTRRYMNDISGQTRADNLCGFIRAEDWLNGELVQTRVEVMLESATVSLAPASFVAVSSACSSCSNECTASDATNNNCDTQRRHLDVDITRWFQAYDASMYSPVVQQALATVTRRVGTGPWGAGAWLGDSQHYFLTVWLATSLLSGSTLDYYVYDNFCENPGNQCFVLGGDTCRECIAAGGAKVAEDRCGELGIGDVIELYQGQPASVLYSQLLGVGPPPDQVFDILAGARQSGMYS